MVVGSNPPLRFGPPSPSPCSCFATAMENAQRSPHWQTPLPPTLGQGLAGGRNRESPPPANEVSCWGENAKRSRMQLRRNCTVAVSPISESGGGGGGAVGGDDVRFRQAGAGWWWWARAHRFASGPPRRRRAVAPPPNARPRPRWREKRGVSSARADDVRSQQEAVAVVVVGSNPPLRFGPPSPSPDGDAPPPNARPRPRWREKRKPSTRLASISCSVNCLHILGWSRTSGLGRRWASWLFMGG